MRWRRDSAADARIRLLDPSGQVSAKVLYVDNLSKFRRRAEHEVDRLPTMRSAHACAARLAGGVA